MENVDKTIYKEDSIQSLSPREFTRLRSGVYCGSTEYSTQLLVEIVSNALDEFTIGHGNKILVDYKDDGSCKVEDFAQGFPINEMREDGETVLQASFDVLNTSGKFDDSGVYNGNVLGLNGIGSKLTNFLSKNLTVTSTREGKTEIDSFKDGIFQNRKVNKQSSLHTGTTVEWTPDPQFFAHGQIDVDKIKKLFHTLTCLCVGLTIELTHNGKDKIVYSSKNGINDLVDDIVKSKELIKDRLNIHYASGKNKLDLVLTYADTYNFTMIPFVNTGETDAGPHISQTKAIITREFNKFFKSKGWLKANDDTLSGDDINEGLVIVFNITAPNVAYDAQTKSRIVKLDMSPFTKILIDSLQNWMAANEKAVKDIADKAINARKAREAAKKARDIARDSNKKTTGLKAKMALSEKFIDCTNKDPSKRNLLCVEGMSAGSAAIEARNHATDCIYMLRGKTISPLKTSVDKILANQEMHDIIQVIGAGFGENFDVNKMQFDKVVITSDQDADGAAIELLLIAFFYTYMQPLVKAGKLYRAITPLYICKKGSEEIYFYSDAEYSDWSKTHSGYDTLRAKGLGELNAADLHRVCFERQNFKRINVSDAKKTTDLLYTLEGGNVNLRKQYIYDNAERLGFNFE